MCGVNQDTHKIPDWLPQSPYVEYAGYVDPAQRAGIVARCQRAFFTPAHIGSRLGWFLSRPWRAERPSLVAPLVRMPEIIEQGVTGYCCQDLEEFLQAVNEVHSLHPIQCRKAAERNHSLEAAYPQYMHSSADFRSCWPAGGMRREEPGAAPRLLLASRPMRVEPRSEWIADRYLATCCESARI